MSRGLPGSPSCEALRSQQQAQNAVPTHDAIAAVLRERLSDDPPDEGLAPARIGEVLNRVGDDQAALRGAPIPKPLARKVQMARHDALPGLVHAQVISSAETLARIVPQMVARGRSAAYPDPALRRLAEEAYLSFANRRSLLLLDLQTQVKRTELPWLRAIESQRTDTEAARASSRALLTDLVSVCLLCYPHTILPNRFLTEARTLVQDAGLDLPLTEELAADIFMGELTPKFLRAATIAAALLEGSLYERYYGIPYQRVRAMTTERSGFGRETCPSLVALCVERAGQQPARASVAANGMIIEQQQIITTHNLAVLFHELALDERCQISGMTRGCFTWIIEQLARLPKGWQQRLRVAKRIAYAWRQMVFMLSRPGAASGDEVLAWMADVLAVQPLAVQETLAPAIRGLAAAYAGRTPHRTGDVDHSDGICLLGWTTGQHWLLRRFAGDDAGKK